MRIDCPSCGPREHGEFTCLGDAALIDRPDDAAEDAAERFYGYLYLRDNPAGPHRELWYHEGGCRAWLVVTRDTTTHRIAAVERAEAVALEQGR